MSDQEIRSVLAQTSAFAMLVPNASVAEVVAFGTLEPIDGAPAWVLGHLLWRGWQVPVIASAVFSGLAQSETTDHARICVTKSLHANERMPYLGLLTQGFPRLITVTPESLTEIPQSTPDVEARRAGIAGRVLIGGQEAVIPDLIELAKASAEALYAKTGATDS